MGDNIVHKKAPELMLLLRAIILFSCMLFCVFVGVQAKQQKTQDHHPDSLQQTVSDSIEQSSPINLIRMVPYLHDVVSKMKAAGITRENATVRGVHKQFSTTNIF